MYMIIVTYHPTMWKENIRQLWRSIDIEHWIEEIYDYQIDQEYVEQKLIDLE